MSEFPALSVKQMGKEHIAMEREGKGKAKREGESEGGMGR